MRVETPSHAIDGKTPSQLARVATITGNCRDAHDSPPTRGRVALLSQASGEALTTISAAELGREGEFQIQVPPQDGTSLSLMVHAEGHSAAHVPVPRAIATNGGNIGVIRLPTGVRVTGKLLNHQGGPARDRVLHWKVPVLRSRWGLAPMDATSFTSGSSRTDPEGRFDLGLVLPGPIYFWSASPGRRRASLDSKTIAPNIDVIEYTLQEPLYEARTFALRSSNNAVPDQITVERVVAGWDTDPERESKSVDSQGRVEVLLPVDYRGRLRFRSAGFFPAIASLSSARYDPILLDLQAAPRSVSLQLPLEASGSTVLLGIPSQGAAANLPRLVPATVSNGGRVKHPLLMDAIQQGAQMLAVLSDWTAAFRSQTIALKRVYEEHITIGVEPIEIQRVRVQIEQPIGAGQKLLVRRALGTRGTFASTTRGRQIATASGWASLEDVLQETPVGSDSSVGVDLVPGFLYQISLASQMPGEGAVVGPTIPTALEIQLSNPVGTIRVQLADPFRTWWGELALVNRAGGRVIRTIRGARTVLIEDLPVGRYCLAPHDLATWVGSLPEWTGLAGLPGFSVVEIRAGDGIHTAEFNCTWAPCWITCRVRGDATETLIDVVPGDSGEIVSPIAPQAPSTDGFAEFGPLPEGNYAIRVFTSGRLTRRYLVELLSGTVHRLQVQPN